MVNSASDEKAAVSQLKTRLTAREENMKQSGKCCRQQKTLPEPNTNKCGRAACARDWKQALAYPLPRKEKKTAFEA